MDKGNEADACNGDQHETDHITDNMDEESASKEKLTTADPNQVKFTSVNLDGFDGKNGEAKVDIQMSQTTVGMGKDELMKYANEPFWVRLRLILFILFWLAWFAMLVGAIIIIIMAPRCPPPPKVEWFQKDGLYQVEVETFKDSDGNGIGDFKGIISKLDYFKMHNIGALMLSAFYKSEGGAIVDHKEVDSKLGTIEDFKELAAKMKEKNIRLVIDFNPNHSSDKHPWFKASVKNQEPFSDYYVWADSATGTADKNKPPNNWPSVDGGSAWEWNDNRQQFYLHTFGKDKPDLNLRNELVQQELREIIEFWLKKDVDGLNVIAASHLMEEEDFSRDEAIAVAKQPDTAQYKDFNHMYTLNQAENLNLFGDWRKIINNFTESSGITKLLMAEVSGSFNSTLPYYGNSTNRLVELIYSNHFTHITSKPTGIELKEHLQMEENLPDFAWPTLLVGSKDVHRLATRVGEELVDAIHMIATLTLGTPIVFYGDELGLPNYVPKNGLLPTSQTVMLWNNETSSGFTDGVSNYPVHTSYETMNVANQDNNKQSHLKVFSRLLSLRNQPALAFGLQEYPIVTDELFSMIRVRKGSPGYLVVVNLSTNSTTVDFTGTNKYLPDKAKVEIQSGSSADGDHQKVTLNKVELNSKQSVVLSFVPLFE